jgi:hypothetical protein
MTCSAAAAVRVSSMAPQCPHLALIVCRLALMRPALIEVLINRGIGHPLRCCKAIGGALMRLDHRRLFGEHPHLIREWSVGVVSAPSITHPSRGNAGSVAWSQHFLAVHPRTKQTRRLFNVKKLNCPSLKFFNFKLCFQLFNYSSPTRGHTTHTGGQAHTTRDYAQGDTRPGDRSSAL